MTVNFNSCPDSYKMYKAMEAAKDINCCSNKGTNDKIMTTSVVAGAVIGFGVGQLPGAGLGALAGGVVGFAIISVKESIKQGHCVIL